MLILGLEKRKDGHDDTLELVEIMEVLMTEMQSVFATGDVATVDHIYNRMVWQVTDGRDWIDTNRPTPIGPTPTVPVPTHHRTVHTSPHG
jgi:hypothetical protein